MKKTPRGLNEELTEASRLVDELNFELSNVHESIESLGPSDLANTSLARNGGGRLSDFERSSMSQLLAALQDKLSAIESAENESDIYDLGTSGRHY